jgi:RimJ/RimL family protein N-acetyltransferase
MMPETGAIDPRPARRPGRVVMEGRYVTLAPLDASSHAGALWRQAGRNENAELWAYLPDGPFAERAAFEADVAGKAATTDRVFFAILDKPAREAAGYASYLRIEPAHRSIEVGYILYTPALQRTRGATEAMYLMARYVFEELGYRRYEWKCNALNEPSRRAALRFGFTFEGIFRQHMIVKGRNRDTAWYSMLDKEWPARKAAFERWLDPANFDEQGRQKSKLK